MKKLKNALNVMFMCHRLPERSFFFKGKQFPLCARCTGILVGYIVGVLYLLFFGIIPLIFSLLILVPTLVDGFGQLGNKWRSNNSRRLITGILAGVGIDFVIINTMKAGFHHGQDLSEVLFIFC